MKGERLAIVTAKLYVTSWMVHFAVLLAVGHTPEWSSWVTGCMFIACVINMLVITAWNAEASIRAGRERRAAEARQAREVLRRTLPGLPGRQVPDATLRYLGGFWGGSGQIILPRDLGGPVEIRYHATDTEQVIEGVRVYGQQIVTEYVYPAHTYREATFTGGQRKVTAWREIIPRG